MMVPPTLCVTGPSGSGKTHLLERLIARLSRQGLHVAGIKHCHHLDRVGSDKDSDRLGRAGARPVIAVADGAVEIRAACSGTSLVDLAAMFCRDCDLVLAEGYKQSIHDKIRLAGPGRPVQLPTTAGRIDRDDTDSLAAWVTDWLERRLALRSDLIGVVLTGGTSGRMGFDKSRLRIAGRSVLGSLCELLADRLGRVMIIGRRPAEGDVPACARWHPDDMPGGGPAGGIATALRIAAEGDRAMGVCVVACDMPLLRGDLLDYLLAGRSSSADRGQATAVVNPRTGRLETLLAVYEPQARRYIESAMETSDAAAGKKPSVWKCLGAAGVRRLDVPDALADQLANVNTPQELEAIRLPTEANGM